MKSVSIRFRLLNPTPTVFGKLLIMYVGILLATLVGQGFLMAGLYQNEFYRQKETSATQDALSLAAEASSALEKGNWPNSSLIRSVYSVVERQQAAVWVVNPYGWIQNIDEPDRVDDATLTPPQFHGYKMSERTFGSVMLKVLAGQPIRQKSLFSGLGGGSVLTIAVPIVVDGEVAGAIFLHTTMEVSPALLAGAYRSILTSALTAIIVGAFLMSVLVSRFSRPLVQMNVIAHSIARGQFDRKADVRSRDEIGQLAQSFNSMADELRKQEELRSGFVANVSHELRSPLTSIHGFAQGMLDGTIPQSEHQKYLDVIVGETRRLNKLIRELLDLSQIESGKFPLNKQNFDLNEMIRRVLITFEEKIDNKNLQIDVDFRQDKAMVQADPDRIEQVLINLLDNAIKFTSDNGHIRIWTHAASDKLLIGIQDDGPGIPEEDQPYIWERFYKVDKSHTGKKGTGLGLSIVKKIIDQHGERITMQSQPGSGTTFVFSLKTADT